VRVFQPFKSIRAKAALLVFLLTAATTVVSYLITVQIMNTHITDEIIKRAESLSRSIASVAGFNILDKNLLGLDNMVFKIKSLNPDIERIAILGLEGNIIVDSDIRQAGGTFTRAEGAVLKTGGDGTVIRETEGPSGGAFEIESPVVFMDKGLGSVVLGINRSGLIGAQKEARRKIVWLFGVVLVLGIAGSVVLSSNLARPVKGLLAGVEELKHGKRGQPLRVYSLDELGRLTVSFNEMSDLITVQQDSLGRYAHDLEEAYISTIRILAAAIDARDHYTLGHSTRVSDLAVRLAQEAGMNAAEVEGIEIACLFHDVGKIRIPDAILHKRGQLGPREHLEMKKHTEYGAELLSKAPSLFKYIPAVRHHHEWFDGSGYPDGLGGEKIPAAAAIISLADAYDAMTSDRPYRTAMTREEALDKIRASSGTQFSPEFVRIFLKLMEKQNPGAPPAPHAPGEG